ncbi:rCG36267 [Rattus norvegicus]|uniref:RCG36267 n=2 Tax=Rattus norvegicus TaxID=10116 RepID=A6IPY6_RAT|nr:melanoma-associated antigen B5 [Rattus norvegicus]EDL96027.1 rCG36267 [Rattus norvegicus]|eukprot:XP_003752106.1 PREDICTED: melanoma-associated antigen B5 [Rattus norvegicus]
MPRGQKSKLNVRGTHRQAINYAQAFEDAKETVEPTEESSSESGGTFEVPEKQSVSTMNIDLFSILDGSSTDLDDAESLFRNYHTINNQDLLARKVLVLVQILLKNYKIKQLTTMEDMMQVIDKEEINDFPEMLRKAAERLADVFAVELREVESSRRVYDLISKLKLPNNGRVRAGQGFPKTGFLMTVLGIIFMSGNCAREEDIWRTLRYMGVYSGKKHQIYGEPRKLITQNFVKLKYLEYRQVANSNPPQYEFLWGPKAYAETNKMTILKFVAKVNDIPPSCFPDLYEEALKDDQGKNQSNRNVSSAICPKARAFTFVMCPGFACFPAQV